MWSPRSGNVPALPALTTMYGRPGFGETLAQRAGLAFGLRKTVAARTS
jgi:hypothetical protein